MSRRDPWVWREVFWPRPYPPELALELLDRLAADHELGPIVWEARAAEGRIRYLVGIHPHRIHPLTELTQLLVPGLRLTRLAAGSRPPLSVAGQVTASHQALALNVDRVTATVRAVLASLASARADGEVVVLQVILGARLSPALVPGNATSPATGWLDLIRGTVRPPRAEERASMKARASQHGFKTTIRIGATAGTPARARALNASTLSGLRVAEAAGVRLHATITAPVHLNEVRLPWRWPLHLSTRELVALIGWPVGDGNLPGLPGEHPRALPPREGLANARHPFAVTSAPGASVGLGISARDSLQHSLLLGPTGSGKSNAMLTLITGAIQAGRGVLVIDPKRDLVQDILARIPENRKGDVVVIDPTDSQPVGLNPFAGSRRNPELVADSILAVFKELFADSWGPRTQDILTAALITLAHHPGATLTMLPSLLTNTRFRRKLTRSLSDPIGLDTFWSSYEAMSVQQRAQVIAPVMNKLRQFLLRPALRAMLGQAQPLFDMGDLFSKRRIVLVSLNKGLIGAESARLLGSLVVSQVWPLVLARAALPPEHRHVVNVFIDEVQDYLALPTDLDSAFSQARGLGVGFTVAHQYRKQLPSSLRSGVDANVQNRIIFGLNAEDAGELAKQAPSLDSQDFMLLPRYGIYANLMHESKTTGWVSAQTLPAGPETTDPIELKNRSAQTYGRDAKEVEAEVLHTIGLDTAGQPTPDQDDTIGRRPAPKRSTQ